LRRFPISIGNFSFIFFNSPALNQKHSSTSIYYQLTFKKTDYMKKVIFVAALMSAFLVTEVASAQGRLNNRNQKVRIEQGVHKGQLTRNEARQLRAKQQRIQAMKRMAKADGVITARERIMIRRAEQNNSVAIYNQKHDKNYRW
jgi:uncharacterized membrane protein YebE (DUF533 family)